VQGGCHACDARSRLTQDTQTGGANGPTTLTWGYDAGDNLTSIGNAATNTTSTLSYDAAHELTGLSTTANGTQTHSLTYSYNANGDRTGQTDAVTSASATFGYDQADRLTSYRAGSTSASYSYNGDGLRVAKTVNGTTTSYVWDLAEGMPLLLQETTGGATTKDLTGAGGLPVEQQNGAGAPQYYVQDQQGSTRALLDSTGTALSTFTYDPYGNLTSSSGTATTPFQYAGQYTDSESGLQYLRARYYDPQTCQFLSVDPFVGMTGEPYAYTAGDPLNLTDPAGLLGWGDVTGFVQQHAQTIAAVGYGVAVGAFVACGVFSLGVCWAATGVVVGADLATGGLLIGGGTLLASTFLPPGEGVVPDGGCSFPEDPREFLPDVPPVKIKAGYRWRPNASTEIEYHEPGVHASEPEKPGHYHVKTYRGTDPVTGRRIVARVRRSDGSSDFFPGDLFP
jgi:RHS repeat-associated protein